MLNVETAGQLLNFRGRISDDAAQEQLEGAVALHNTLEKHSVAYLADEVGMGKTYVALGAFALFRHFDPTFRLLVIAPRENIQAKWIKELRNFVKNNVQVADLRVKALHGVPARPPVACANLYEFLRETKTDPDRDFFVRFGSFSFGMKEDDSEERRKLTARLCEEIPWIDPALVPRGRNEYKGFVARALNCAMPTFDLVIVDEAHNLKHGIEWSGKKVAARNRMMSLAFGNDGENLDSRTRKLFQNYGLRAKKVLFLSATPVESDYAQLYNQLKIFGKHERFKLLTERDGSEEQKRRLVQEFLIRRLTSMRVGGSTLTKNLYRREWRAGGVGAHDDALRVPDEKQRLVVALMQKKMSELIGSERFNNSFQVGMLSSFESFMQTAKATTDEQEWTFDDVEQTEDADERRGVDVHAVNRIAESYWRKFGTHLPHPKMDALVERLSSCFDTGEKGLVFVRRVASVKELQRKLEERYDEWLFARLRTELSSALQPEIEEQIAAYRAQRTARAEGRSLDIKAADENDRGGTETFFAWFFRGEGPSDVLSGARLASRFTSLSSTFATFFDENYVASLLDVRPGKVFDELARVTSLDEETLRARLRARASTQLPDVRRQTRKHLFHAYQFAALSLLQECATDPELKMKAEVMRDLAFERAVGGAEAPDEARRWLEEPTFFTELRLRARLDSELWPDELPSVSIRYPDRREAFAAAFTRGELRRELIGSTFRLGHSMIDLYVLAANRIGTLALRSRDDRDDVIGGTLFDDVLDLLESQRASTKFRAYRELLEGANHFDLIVDVNVHEAWQKKLAEVSREFGRLLRAQQPIGGMFAQVNKTLVAQFRMPGYPFVLITTDLLQEGEDLHTFCSSIYHYGISWMPSSMEQRTGRIDRVSSQSERRLAKLTTPEGDDLLQVYYPHLQETVEVYQVNRVLHRMNEFMRLMHERLGSEVKEERTIDVAKAIEQGMKPVPQIREKLETAFPIQEWMIEGDPKPLAVTLEFKQKTTERVKRLLTQLSEAITWEPSPLPNQYLGTLALHERRQPFSILLHSVAGRLCIRCVSPVGKINFDQQSDHVAREAAKHRVRIGAVRDDRFREYDLTAEDDTLLTGVDAIDVHRLRLLVTSVTAAADDIERVVLRRDAALGEFRNDFGAEAQFER